MRAIQVILMESKFKLLIAILRNFKAANDVPLAFALIFSLLVTMVMLKHGRISEVAEAVLYVSLCI